jgi:predicted nucleic acid-binding protein
LTDRIALDTSPLSLLSHPNEHEPRVKEIRDWLEARLSAGAVILIPEIADYEVRRELLRLGRQRSLQRLNGLQSILTYLPLDTPTMRRAAELWALARQRGTPTADPKEIDADVILAAQAERAQAAVATDNAGHLGRFVAAKHWRDFK